MKNITTLQQFEGCIKSSSKAVVHFWAGWCEPCALLDSILEQLERDSPGVSSFRVEAEQAPDISERCGVAAVPLFLFFNRGAEIDRLEGADPGALTAKFGTLAGSAAAPAAGDRGAAAAPPAANSGSEAALQARLAALVRQAPIMLFMKGTPEQPRCGFSAQVVAALRSAGAADFGSFDILSDDAVRQGLKEFSQWPTYPQLYANGELVGGCDIVLEMAASGELKGEIAKAHPAAAPAAPAAGGAAEAPIGSEAQPGELQARLEALVNSNEVMLFMKGTPDEPRCGFSRKVVDALRAIHQPFGSFDILGDDAVRQGLKEFSQWPTYPQLYANGELVGGCDIVLEMAASGELQGALLKQE